MLDLSPEEPLSMEVKDVKTMLEALKQILMVSHQINIILYQELVRSMRWAALGRYRQNILGAINSGVFYLFSLGSMIQKSARAQTCKK